MRHSILRLPLLLAAFCANAHAADSSAPGKLFIDHVNGYTLDAAGRLHHFEAMLIDGGKVRATGSHVALIDRAADARVLDGQGATLLPGLIDAHGHVFDLGFARNS